MSPKEVLIGESGQKQKTFKLPRVKCAEKKSCKEKPHSSSFFSSAFLQIMCYSRKKTCSGFSWNMVMIGSIEISHLATTSLSACTFRACSRPFSHS